MSSGPGASTSGVLGSGGNAGHGYEPRKTIRPVFDRWKAIDWAIWAWIVGRFARWYSSTRLTSQSWPYDRRRWFASVVAPGRVLPAVARFSDRSPTMFFR